MPGPAVVIIGTCLELLGTQVAMDTYAGMPWCDSSGCHTTSLVGAPVEMDTTEPGMCWLPAPVADPFFDFVWCQTVEIGEATYNTPCGADFVAYEDAPCSYKVWQAKNECWPAWESWGWCTVAPVPGCE
jgi:hypothetical protein